MDGVRDGVCYEALLNGSYTEGAGWREWMEQEDGVGSFGWSR